MLLICFFEKDNTEEVKEVYKSSPADSETPPSLVLFALTEKLFVVSCAGVNVKLSSLYLILPPTDE